MSDVTDYGFTSSDNFYNIASAVFSQTPHIVRLYLGRRLAGDANVTAALDACQAEDGASWYGVMNESRTDAEILAVAAWCESRFKLAMCQTTSTAMLNGTGQVFTLTIGGTPADGDYVFTFTGFGLGSPTAVTITRAAGAPATNALLGTALANELDTQNGTGGDIEGIISTIVDNEDGTVVITMSRSVVRGTLAATSAPGGATVARTVDDDDVARQLFTSQYSRCALLYYATDATFAEAAWLSRCMAFDLDEKKGIWAFKELNGITQSELTSAQTSAIRSVNGNYYAPIAPSSGVETVAYTAQGWLPKGTAGAGRRIDFQTTLDWTQARMEEALLNVLLRETHGVPYNDSGIGRFKAAASSVFSTGISAGHYEPYLVPSGNEYAGRITPFVDAPRFSETTTTQRAARTITLTAVGYVRSAIESVTFNVLVKQ
jgi:hypothetical protein